MPTRVAMRRSGAETRWMNESREKQQISQTLYTSKLLATRVSHGLKHVQRSKDSSLKDELS
jgi:putative SOS response-associated peptidase YedK